MIIRAELKCKQTGCEADPCAVDKLGGCSGSQVKSNHINVKQTEKSVCFLIISK